jgi:hypothetical protein
LSSPALARFSNVSELLTDLHTRRNGDPGTSIAGELVSVLICARRDTSDFELIQAILVLAFTPTIHRTHRELCAWFRELESEDIAQQIFTLFLELVTSASPPLLNSYLPIALTRTLRKNAFRWAEKEQRVAIMFCPHCSGSPMRFIASEPKRPSRWAISANVGFSDIGL